MGFFMLTCLSDIKINADYYTDEYKRNFDFLVNQKEKDRNGKIDQIMAKLKDEKILEIEGNGSFKERIYTDIRKLLTVKPGRLLIKELIKLVKFSEKSIRIKSGEMDFHHSVGIIELSPNEYSAYNALFGSNKVVCLRPKEIVLAHELIHDLHKKEEGLQNEVKWYLDNPWVQERHPPPDYIKDIEVYPDPKFAGGTFEGLEIGILLKDLDNLHEQRAILGLNFPRFLKRNKQMNQLDVLCENAFLCAFKFFPRIDHKTVDNHCIEDVQENENKNGLSSYYNWILLQINERNERVEKTYSNLITIRN
jgi:hypothetical protein